LKPGVPAMSELMNTVEKATHPQGGLKRVRNGQDALHPLVEKATHPQGGLKRSQGCGATHRRG